MHINVINVVVIISVRNLPKINSFIVRVVPAMPHMAGFRLLMSSMTCICMQHL